MTSGFTALIFAVGVMAWVYNKMSRRTGNSPKSTLTITGVAGFMAFLVFFTILKYFLKV